MSTQQVSQTPSTPSPLPVSTQPTAPVKAPRAKKEKVVKEKVVKVVKEKVVAAKAEKVVKEKKVKAAEVEEVVEEVVCVPEEVEVEKAEKKARTPTLPAKFNRFIQFSYHLIRTLNNAELEKNGEVLFDEDRFFEEANVFAAVDVQQRFVEGFLENKAIGKEMRTHVLDKKKAEKAAAKQKIADDKAVAKKKVIDDKAAAKKKVAEDKAAAKKPATKKKAKKEEPVDLVTSLVTLANSSNDDVKTVNEEIEEEEEEDELDVKVIEIEGKQYLIDDSSNLYDSGTHLMIGTWNCVTKEITRV
jgi:hypothetical protein